MRVRRDRKWIVAEVPSPDFATVGRTTSPILRVGIDRPAPPKKYNSFRPQGNEFFHAQRRHRCANRRTSQKRMCAPGNRQIRIEEKTGFSTIILQAAVAGRGFGWIDQQQAIFREQFLLFSFSGMNENMQSSSGHMETPQYSCILKQKKGCRNSAALSTITKSTRYNFSSNYFQQRVCIEKNQRDNQSVNSN